MKKHKHRRGSKQDKPTGLRDRAARHFRHVRQELRDQQAQAQLIAPETNPHVRQELRDDGSSEPEGSSGR